MPTSKQETIIEKWYDTDAAFNQLYPLPIRQLSSNHWTPLSVARKAAQFLAAEKKVKILDIGSGVGKFCLSAAHFMPLATYYGVEQRKTLIEDAEAAKDILGVNNVTFNHGNFTQLNFHDYNHFYFYNSFYENLSGTTKIDESIDYSSELYHYYCRYLYKQLDKMPAATRLATFHSLEDEIPPDYHVVGSDMDNLLKYWIKV